MLIPGIIDEHAAEAAFLWAMRARIAVSPIHDLADLAEHDERIAAHLDGLSLAGDDGWRAASEAMVAKGRADEAFPAAWLAGMVDGAGRLPVVLAAVADNPDLVPGVAAAIAWLPVQERLRVIDRCWQAGSPGARRAVIDGLAQIGTDPGQRLPQALGDADTDLRRSAILAVAACGRGDGRGQVASALRDPEPRMAQAAAWTLAVLGDMAAVVHLQRQVEAMLAGVPAAAVTAPAPRAAEPLLDLIGRRLPAADGLAWAQQRFGESRSAVVVADAAGDTAAVPWLLACCRQPLLARRAGAAIARMCGMDLTASQLTAPPPDGFAPPGPNDDPADDDVEPDPDGHLPFPDAARLDAWWERHAGSHPPGQRRCAGLLAETSVWKVRLRCASQAERWQVALELALADGRVFPVQAPAVQQHRWLEGLA